MEQARKQIQRALSAFAVKGAVKIIRVAHNRYSVWVKGRYFGIFDIDCNTFVD